MTSTSASTPSRREASALSLSPPGRNAEAFAKRAAGAIKSEEQALVTYAEKLRGIAETEMGKTLAICVEKGAAFHHAGLSPRRTVHCGGGVPQGIDQVHLFHPDPCCRTQPSGARVIIRDYLRFSAGEGMQPIPVSDTTRWREGQGVPGSTRMGRPFSLQKTRHRSRNYSTVTLSSG